MVALSRECRGQGAEEVGLPANRMEIWEINKPGHNEPGHQGERSMQPGPLLSSPLQSPAQCLAHTDDRRQYVH